MDAETIAKGLSPNAAALLVLLGTREGGFAVDLAAITELFEKQLIGTHTAPLGIEVRAALLKDPNA